MRYDASPGFLQTMGARLLRGRDVAEYDDLKSPVVLIDDNLARKLFGEKDPLGQRIMLPPEIVGEKFPGIEVVGVYAHMRHFEPGASGGPIQLGMIMPYAEVAQFAPQWFQSYYLLARSDGDPQPLASAIRSQVQAMDPEAPIFDVKTMEAAVDESLAGRRFSMILFALFAAAALALAAVGVYGVMSYGVEQRTREIGIRMALGAEQGDVVRMVVGGGARLAAAGIGIGVALALGLSRVLRGMLFGVGAFDLLTYAGLALVLALIALLASWLPARRAARVDPNLALRAD
jgi:predicted permease